MTAARVQALKASLDAATSALAESDEARFELAARVEELKATVRGLEGDYKALEAACASHVLRIRELDHHLSQRLPFALVGEALAAEHTRGSDAAALGRVAAHELVRYGLAKR